MGESAPEPNSMQFAILDERGSALQIIEGLEEVSSTVLLFL